MTTFPVSPATISATITLIHVSVMKYFGQTQAEASGDLKDLAAEFSTNERTSSSIDDDLLNIIEGLINNKLPKRRLKD